MKIAYLYYDFLNLYGESGNIKIISNILKENKIKHEILYLSLEDKLDFDNYDFVYIGSGTEENINIAMNHLMKYKKQIKKYIDDNKFFFVTGNSVDMFGKTIDDTAALDIFDYKITRGPRKMEEVYINSNVTKNKILGFYNNNSYIDNVDNYLFENEGFLSKNFYATYILGPILVRNPEFLKYLLSKFIDKKIKYNLTLEKKAYNEFVKRFKENVNE